MRKEKYVWKNEITDAKKRYYTTYYIREPINKDFHITEELVSLVVVKGKTTTADVQRTVELAINHIGVKYE